MPQAAKPVSEASRKRATSEMVFKSINITLLTILAFCVKGFLEFRKTSIEQGLYVFAVPSLVWCIVGFIGRFVVKYSYLKLSDGIMSRALSEKNDTEEERLYRLKSLKKLSFDTLFYIGITWWAYYLFRREYWFPGVAGGEGECSAIYREYPNWPSDREVSTNMERYFMVQMGIHLFSLFELLFIIGSSYRKYHEFLLHHCVTIFLMLFSMMSNQIVVGVIIIIIHDASDIFSSFGRGYLETKYRNPVVIGFSFVTMLGSWVYLRAIVYPFCILTQAYKQIPEPTDYWYPISFEHKTLLAMATVLAGMHIFWIYFILEYAFKKTKGNHDNTHEAATPAKKST